MQAYKCTQLYDCISQISVQTYLHIILHMADLWSQHLQEQIQNNELLLKNYATSQVSRNNSDFNPKVKPKEKMHAKYCKQIFFGSDLTASTTLSQTTFVCKRIRSSENLAETDMFWL